MNKKLFLGFLILLLMLFVTGICFAAKGNNKGAGSQNRQSLETSTKGKERAEQRHKVKEEKQFGNEDDEFDKDDKDEKKTKKDKLKTKGDKDKEDDKSGDDDDDKEKEADGLKASSPEEGSQDGNKSRKWWEFYKKSE